MSSSLYVYNLSKAESQISETEIKDVFGSALIFQTCLRYLVITNHNLSDSENLKSLKLSFYEDKEAYKFLLQVLCGLESPVIGETEVFGQFKNQILNSLDSKHILFKGLTQIVSDVKKIRAQHLVNLGSSSYGSLARKYLSNFKSLDIIGAGQFVQSLKPWIEKLSLTTSLYTRKFSDYSEIYKNSSFVLKGDLSDFKNNLNHPSDVLFICAPIELTDLDLTKYKLVLDFRDYNENCFLNNNYRDLKSIFSEIENGNRQALIKKATVLKEIEHLSESYMSSMSHRPFGWDDLSA